MEFEYLIDEKNYNASIVKMFKNVILRSFSILHIFVILTFVVFCIQEFFSTNGNVKSMIIQVINVFVGWIIIIIYIRFMSKLAIKRNVNRTINEAKKTIGYSDSTKVLLKQMDKHFHVYVNEQEYIFKTKNLRIFDIGTAYCLSILKGRQFMTKIAFVIPQKNEDKEYTDNLTNFMNELSKKAAYKRISKRYKNN